jgi:molybdopterin biosynthesis enzyme
LRWDDGQGVVEPLRWQGSGDLSAVSQANALTCFAAGDRMYRAGEMVRVLELPSPR